MQNGDSLDIGDYLQFGNDAMPIPNGSVIISAPGSRSKYYVFYTDLSFIDDTANGVTYTPTKLEYSIVNMSLNNGIGKVEKDQRNISILNDTLTETGIEAVKHGNGNDWWLFCHKYNSNRYYRFLIDKGGIHGPYKQDIGNAIVSENEIYNIFRFSQDGSKAIQNYTDSTLFEYYDFDRCSGTLSNPRVVHVSDMLYYLMGLSFSPNGRYAYLSANYWQYLFQFDLQAQDIESSKVLIAIYDGATNPFKTDFFDHALASDGKIYICTFDDNNSLHVINDPDSSGKKCNFVENGFSLLPNTYWNGGVPNLPNYHLGALESCDSIVTGIPSVQSIQENVFTYTVYPNPCIEKFQLSITGVNSKTEVVIYNEMGEVIEQTTLQPENGFIHTYFNLQNEPAGVYLLKAQTDRGSVEEKILKQ